MTKLSKPEIELKKTIESLGELTETKAVKLISLIATTYINAQYPSVSDEDKALTACVMLNKSIRKIGKDIDVTPGKFSKALELLKENKPLTSSVNKSFKYWYVDQAGDTHYWKGTGIPPKGFRELAMQQRLEEYHINRSSEPKLL